MVLDELTNPDIYTKVITGASQSIDGELVRNIPFEYAANMIAISLADLTARGAPDYLLTTPDFADDRAALKALVAKAREEIASTNQVSPETLANCRATIKGLKDKVDSLLAQTAPNRLDVRQLPEGSLRPDQDARDPLGGAVPAGAEDGVQDGSGPPDLLHAHLQPAFRRLQDAGSGGDLRSALPAARRGSRPGQGAQRQPLYDLQRPARSQGVFRLFLTDAVRPETRCRASSSSPARPALMGGNEAVALAVSRRFESAHGKGGEPSPLHS